MAAQNWHRADIVAAIHKRGTSLAELARDNGLADATLRAALSYPRKPSNQLVADFLGKQLHEIWPAWFDSEGQLLSINGSRPHRRASSQKRSEKLTLTRRRA